MRVDALHNPPTLPHMRARSLHIDHSFVTTAGRALDLVGKSTAPACFIPNAVDSGIETGEAHLTDRQTHDAIYSRRPVIDMPEGDYRTEVVTTLESDPALKVISIGIHGGKQIFGQAYFDLVCAARIGLNLSARALNSIEGHEATSLMRLYSSDRIAHYGGNGLVILNHHDFSLHEIMREGEEFADFKSPAEALEKTRWLIDHPQQRMAMAKAGHAAFHSRFSAERVAGYILAKAFPVISGRHCGLAKRRLYRSVVMTDVAPSIVAIIVTFESAGVLPACLDALAREGIAAIIVDNASRDDTIDVARRAGAAVISNALNEGFGRGMNIGAEAASDAHYLLLLQP